MPSSFAVAFQNATSLTGDQNFGGSLGMDFTVDDLPVVIYDVGAFDDGQGTMAASITVGIYDIATEHLISQLVTLSATAGTQIGSSRFETLATPLLLNPGSYSVVAWGYDAAMETYNQGGGTQNALLTTNSDNGAISFVGSGRYTTAADSFPTVIDGAPVADPFGAGSFEFSTADVALENPTTLVGNQNFNGSLGMDFTVNTPMAIYDLGAFDDGQATMAAAITVGVYNVATEQLVSQLVTLSGTAGTQVENSRFEELTTPLILNSGTYSIVAWGYDAQMEAYNQGAAGSSGIIENTDGGAITFVGSGRYDTSAGVFPTTPDAGPADRYGAGSFEYGSAFVVSNETELNAAIEAVNAGATGTIQIANNITLTSDLTAINGNVTIDGNGFAIDGDGFDRGLMVLGGSVTVENLDIVDATAFGGAGGYGRIGGGGGAGLGGGLFVGTGASVTLSQVGFALDSAFGGAGGSNSIANGYAHAGIGSGGGGGMGGWGGNGGYSNSGGAGGGIGFQAYGQSALQYSGANTDLPYRQGGWKQILKDLNNARNVVSLGVKVFSDGSSGGLTASLLGENVAEGIETISDPFTPLTVLGLTAIVATVVFHYTGVFQSKPVGLGGGPGAGTAGWVASPTGTGGGTVVNTLPGFLKYIHYVAPIEWVNNYSGGTGAAGGGGGGAGWGGAGGGGGISGTNGATYYAGQTPLRGGNGGFGGGGGGGAGGAFATIGNGNGGAGGFGGGGGGGGLGGGLSGNGSGGGAGGFGGGGGGNGGAGGYGAGSGSAIANAPTFAYSSSAQGDVPTNHYYGGAGGGGLGAGGAVFVQAGGALTFAGGGFGANYVAGGPGGYNYDSKRYAQSGNGLGSGIFFQTASGSQSSVTLAPPAGQTLYVGNVITGGGGGAGTVFAGGAGLVWMALPSPSTIDIEAGDTLEETGALAGSGALLNAGTLVLAPGANTTLTATVSALSDGAANTFNDALEKAGNATLTFANKLYVEGIMDVDSGTVVLETGTTPYGPGVQDNLFGALFGSGNVSLAGGVNLVLGFDAGDTTSDAIQPVTDFTGNITGNGAVIVQGGGTQTLSGSNAGSATILAGNVLALTGAGAQFPNGITDNGTLILDGQSPLNLGPISGSGTVINAGGTATLPSASGSSFQGVLLINGGTAALAGSLPAHATVVDDATLNLQPGGNDTLSATVSGTGNVLFNSAGTTTLEAALPVSGGVTLQSGTLLVPGAPPTLGSAIVDNAALIFANPGNSVEYQAISGSGTIVQAGAGSLFLASIGALTGALDVVSGTLGLAAGMNLAPMGVLEVTQGTFELDGGTLIASSAGVTSATVQLGGGTLVAGTLSGTGGTIELGGGSLLAKSFAAGFGDAVLGPGAFSVGNNTTLQNGTTITGVTFGNNDVLGNSGLVQGHVYAGTGFTATNAGTINGTVSFTSGVATNQADTEFLESGGPGNTTTSLGVILGGVTTGAATLTNGGTIVGAVNMLDGTLTNLAHFTASYPTKSQYYRYSSAGIIQGSVSATGTLDVSNGGTIGGNVYLGSGTITNFGLLNEEQHPANSLITHVSPGVILGGISDSGSLVLNNAGTVDGLVAMASGSVTNDAAGSFNEPAFGQYETITAGLLRGGVRAAGALYLQNNGVIQNGVTLGSGTIFNNLPDLVGNPVPSLLQGGITASGAGYVRNDSTIAGGITFGGAGTIVNQTFSAGVNGFDTYNTTILGNILLEGAGSSINNSGTILGNVTLSSGGTVFNGTSGTITSVYVSGPGTIINENTIGAATIGHGATLTNVGFAIITSVGVGPDSEFTNSFEVDNVTDGGSFTNANLITGNVTVFSGGYFLQTSGAVAQHSVDDLGTIVNLGVLDGTVTAGVGGTATLTNISGGFVYKEDILGTLTNYGTLTGQGITIQSGGLLINQSDSYKSNFLIFADHGTVVNDGTISGNHLYARLYSGATFINAANANVSNLHEYGGVLENSGTAVNVDLISDFPGIEPTATNLSSGTVNGIKVNYHTTFVDQGTLAGNIQTYLYGTLSFGSGLAASANSLAQLTNAGTLLNSVVSFGTLVNQSTGRIFGNVAMPSGGLNNQGTIHGNVTGSGTGSFVNSDRIFGSVEGGWSTGSNVGLLYGNFLQTTAASSSYSLTNGGFVGGEFGIYGSGTARNQTGATVTGAGILSGSNSTLAQYGTILGGIQLTQNNERLILSPAAHTVGTITGASAAANNGDVLELQAGTGTLSSVSDFGTIVFDTGANWVLGSGDTFVSGMSLSGATSLTVAGLLQNGANIAVPVTVQSGATLVNAASLTGAVNDAGTLINSEYIEFLTLTGSSVTNIAGGTIASPLTLAGTSDFLSNAGTLLSGVTLTGSGATVINTGVILGAVDVGGPSETVQTGGSIAGGVTLTGSGDQLIVLPGVSFSAPVTANSTAKLELGAGYGTLTNLGSEISGFGSYVALAGAHWLLAGSFTNTGSLGFGGPGTVAISGTVVNAGTLAVLSVTAGGVVVNQAGATITGNLVDAGTLIDQGTVTGSISLSSGGQLTVAAGGTIVGGVSAAGTGIGITLGGAVGGPLDITGSGDVLSLAPGYAIGGSSIQAGNTIELSAGTRTLTNVSLLGQAVQVAPGGAWKDNESGTSSGGLSLSGGGSLTLTGSIALSDVQVSIASLIEFGTLASPVTLGTNGVLLQSGTLNGAVAVAGNLATLADYGVMTGPLTVSGANDLIVLRAGETISGGITGGQGSTLELLAGAGTLSSLYGFSNIEVAAGANWTILNPGTLSGVSISGTGTLMADQALTIDGSVSNAATLNATLLVAGTFANNGFVKGTIVDTGSVAAGGTIAAGITLASAGELSIPDGTLTGPIVVTANDRTIAQTGVISGPVTISGHADVVALYSAGGFGGGVTGAADGSSLLDVANSVSLANLANYSNVPNISAAAGVTMSLGDLASNETFAGAGTLSVQTLSGTATLTNAGYVAYGILLTGNAALINLQSGTVGGYPTGHGGSYRGSPHFANATSGAQTITNYGTIGRLSLGAGGVLQVAPSGTFTQPVYGHYGAAGSTLRLLAGQGTINGFGDQLSPSHPAFYWSFNNFSAINVMAGGTWSLPGAPVINDSLTVSGAGTLDLPQGLRNQGQVHNASNTYTLSGALTVTGTVTNAGHLQGGVTLAGSGGFINLAGGYFTNGGVTVTGTGQTVGNFATASFSYTLYGRDRLIIGGNATFDGTNPGGTGNTLEIAAQGPFSLTDFNLPAGATFSTLQIDSSATVATDPSDVLWGVTVTGGGTLLPQNFGQHGSVTREAAGTLLAQGTISAIGVFVPGGYTLTNASGGTIVATGARYGAVTGERGSATVVNLGSIHGTGPGPGVELPQGGMVTNLAGGVIAGGGVGIYAAGQTATVVTAGTIAGTADAVSFAPTTSGELIIDPGAVFAGTVSGGGFQSRLDFVSAGNNGTIAGLGTKYVGFGQVWVDAGASRVLAGTNTVGPNTTLFNAGTLILGVPAIVGGGAATLVDAGALFGGVTVTGGGNVLALAPGAILAGAVSAAAGSVLELQAGAGTLHSLYGFTTIVADAGADWTLSNIPALTGGLTLTGPGTIAGALTGSVSLNNSATLNASLNAGAVENYGVILGTITSAGPIDNRGSIGAAIKLTGSGGLYNHVAAPVGGPVYATGSGETVVNWGDITGRVILSGHDDGVELIGAGTYAGGVFAGGVTGAADGSSSFYLPATNLDLSSLALANFANYTNVPNLSIAAGITLGIQTLDRNETFNGSGTLYVQNLSGGTLTNAGYMQAGVTLSNSARLINLPGATLAGYATSGPGGGPVIKNFTTGNQTITNLGTMGGVSLGAGGVLELGPAAGFTQNVYAYHTGPDSYAGGSYGGTLRLLAGAGAITGFGDSQFQSTQYFPVYSFNNFNTIDVAAGGAWSLNGAPKIANALLVSGAGTLNLSQGLVVEHGDYRNYANLVAFEPSYYERGYLTVSGRLTNSGVLQGNVALAGTGGFVNLAGANLSGGISVTGPGQTVGNLGAMSGGVALYGRDRLIEGAGAAFGGAISGGTGNNTLEIASGPFALTNFNAPGYAQFSMLQIDAGVSVTQDSSDTLAGIALANFGTIDLSAGFTAQAPLTNGGMLTGDVTLASSVPITNVAGGTISGDGLAVIEGGGGPALVFNAGLIDPATYGAYLPAGGYVTNAAGGTILGTVTGVKVSGASGTVVNAGSIAGTGADSTGVGLISGGFVTNQSGGTIDGALYAVQASNAATITNDGRIGVGATVGVGLSAGVITNAAGATIAGSSSGIRIYTGGTVVNAGTISGGGDAVHFYTGSVGRLVVDPGAVFNGTADGGNAVGASPVSTLEFASAAAAGTLSGIGSRYVGFGSIVIDTGAAWTLTGTNTLGAGGTIDNAGTLTLSNAALTDDGAMTNDGTIVLDPSTMFVAGLLGTGAITLAAGATLEVGGTIASTETIVFGGTGAVLDLDNPGSVAGSITGFVQSDTIDLTGIAPGSINYTPDVLSFTPPGGDVHDVPLTLGTGTVLDPAAPDGSGGASLTALCFCAGTLIRTPSGDVPVEALRVGDIVRTWSGGTRPITWIGVGKVLATRGRRSAATPVIVRKGALADNVPACDLRVTKGHSLLLDNVLIPVEFLVNHRSIIWDDRAQEVSLFHIELDSHDVVIANGAPAESYRDDGNRWLFCNSNSGWNLPPQEPCSPVLTGGSIVDAIWLRLLEQAGPRKHVPLTDDPDPHLMVDGKRVDAIEHSPDRYVFRVPKRPYNVRIVSRSAVPQELGFSRDARLLGIAVKQMVLVQGPRQRTLNADATSLADGYHDFETEGGVRWTDGDAAVPAVLFDGIDRAAMLILHLGGTTQYLEVGTASRAA